MVENSFLKKKKETNLLRKAFFGEKDATKSSPKYLLEHRNAGKYLRQALCGAGVLLPEGERRRKPEA